MTLGERQTLFNTLLLQLLARMWRLGFEPRLKEVQRAGITALIYSYTEHQCFRVAALIEPEFPELASAVRFVAKVEGNAKSVHVDGLAADIALFHNGEYLEGNSDYEDFGLWWAAQHELARWGGEWGDANHFSITPDGIRK